LRRIFYSEHGWAVRKRPALKPEDLCRTCSLDLAVAVTGEYIRQLINRETGLAVADHQTKHEGVHCRDPEPGYAATVVLVLTDRTERRKIATAITETLTAARCVFTGVPGSVVRWRVTGRVPSPHRRFTCSCLVLVTWRSRRARPPRFSWRSRSNGGSRRCCSRSRY